MTTRDLAQAAPYPQTDHAETSAITSLKSLLSHPQLKLDIKERDKVPNYDGMVEILDGTLRPMGKIELQVKYLNDKDRARKGYSCSTELLAYALNAPLPVVLAAVAASHGEVYWCELTRTLCERLLAAAQAESKGSITVRFPTENVVPQMTVQAVLQEWSSIVANHFNRIASFDQLAKDVKRLRAIEEAVAEIGAGLPVGDPQAVSELQAHIAEINRLLDGAFGLVKKRLFPEAWQVGIAFADYTPTSLALGYFPIRRGAIDVPIKKVTTEKFRNIKSGTSAWSQENPIKDDAVAHAHTYVAEQLRRLIDADAFEFTHEALTRELLFAVCDDIGPQLGLAPNNTYSVDDLLFGWRTYLPNWLAHVFQTIPKGHLIGLMNASARDGYIKIDALRWATRNVARKTDASIDLDVRARIARKDVTSLGIPVGLRDLPIGHVLPCLTRLSLNGVQTVSRLYNPLDLSLPSRTGATDLLAHEHLIANVRTFYEQLPSALDNVVERNFPRLRRRPTYFDGFDSLRVKVLPGSRGAVVHADQFKGGTRKGICVFSDTGAAGDFGEVVGERRSTADFIFRKTPLFTAVRDELKAHFVKLERWLD